MNITYITKLEEVQGSLENIMNKPALGMDTETTGFTPRVADISLLQIATDPETVYVFNVRKLKDQGQSFDFLYDLLKNEACVKVMQNAKFDLQFMQKLVGRRLRVRSLTDTMLASQLLAYGDKSVRHRLSDISKRELGAVVDKALQSSNFSGPEFTAEQILYAAKDAAVVLEIRDKQAVKITENGLRRVARIEFDAVMTLAEMEYRGIYVDPDIWQSRVAHQKARYEELKQQIFEKWGSVWPVQKLWDEPSVNLDSPSQMLEFLHRLGVMVPSTDEDALIEYQNAHPVMPYILEYREMETAKKKFGESYNRFIDTVTGRIHASFWQMEAPTGRMSSRDPNLMQIPKKSIYRDAFRAESPQGKMITAD